MSTLRISNIEAKSVPASATVDEKVKITNSSGDTLVFIDGKTSGITTVGINTTDGNITFDANSNVVVTGIITATKFSGQFEPTSVGIADSIFHTGDTNTAIRFPAADTISFETAGTERLRIDINGNMGLGTLLASDAGSAGAGLKIEKYVQRNNIYAFPDGYYAASLGEVNNTQTKVWASVDSHYARTSAVSAGLFLSAFHQDAGGSGCGSAIKNLKTGNALTFSTVTTGASVGSVAVETERVRIDSSGRLLVGTSSDVAGGAISSKIQVRSTSYDAAIAIVANRSNTAGGNLSFTKTRGTSEGDTTIVQSGDTLGTINFFGADGTADEANAASIYAAVDGTPGTNDMPGRLIFATTADGAASPTERLRIYNDGRVAVNTPTGTGFSTGKVHIKSSAQNIGQLYLEQNNATDGYMINQDGPNGGHLKFVRDIGGTQTVNVLFRSDRGICFNGDSAAANALDDYEEGSWTPLLHGYWSGGWRQITIGSGTVEGATYTKVGRLVYFKCYFNGITMSGNGPNTYARIYGLPFTSANNGYGSGTMVTHSNAFENTNTGNFYVSPNASDMISTMYGEDSFNYARWSQTSFYMMLSGVYEAA